MSDVAASSFNTPRTRQGGGWSMSGLSRPANDPAGLASTPPPAPEPAPESPPLNDPEPPPDPIGDPAPPPLNA